jgi:hypothetical protein
MPLLRRTERLRGFGSNQAMLDTDAQQASATLIEYMSSQTQLTQRQTTLNTIAFAMLAGAVLIRMVSK